MKIQFVNNGLGGSEKNHINSINPAYFFLRAYYLLHGKNPNVEWFENEWFMADRMSVQLNRIVKRKPDIVACSVYVWNVDYQFKLMEKIRELLPECIIVAGGPQLSAHKEKDFFDKHPYVDYVCYGDGEEAFQLLIDRISGYLPENTMLYNMVENLKPGYKLHPLKILSDEKYLSTSSFLIQKEKVIESLNYIMSKGIKKETLQLSLEFARGCMYACSFCDWSQNLTKKVKRRTHDWKSELDFFYDLDITVRDSDANFGIFKEDIKIFDYSLELFDKDPTRNFKLYIHNTPKLQKEVTYYIKMEQLKRYTSTFVISLQDIHEDVLANIDRPSIPWEEQKELIHRIKKEGPKDKKYNIVTHLIVGLPGQTVERIGETILELAIAGADVYHAFNWTYLENSPAANPAYKEKFNLEWSEVWRPLNGHIRVDNLKDLESLFEKLSKNEVDLSSWFRVKILTQNNTMNITDIMHASVFIKRFQTTIAEQNITDPNELRILKDKLLEESRKDVVYNLQIQKNLAKKYGFYIYGLLDFNGNIIRRI